VLAAFAAAAWQGSRTVSLASAALLRGDYRAAAGHADTARRWQPWASEPWRQLGLAQIGLGDLGGARASFRHAVANDPDDWQTWYDLAIVSHGAERATAVRHARRLNPLAEELRPFASTG
jgi:Flp pilus assembly protein TadD